MHGPSIGGMHAKKRPAGGDGRAGGVAEAWGASASAAAWLASAAPAEEAGCGGEHRGWERGLRTLQCSAAQLHNLVLRVCTEATGKDEGFGARPGLSATQDTF